MDVKNFLRIKPKPQLASQKAVQPLPNPELEAQSHPLPTPELEARSELQKESIEKPPQLQESQDRAKPSPDAEIQLPQEPVGGYLESLATIEREESISGSGWGYSQLLKEFRE